MLDSVLKHGEGSIRTQKNGKLNLRKTVKLKNGEKKDVSVTGKSLVECLEKMKKKELLLNQNLFDQENKILCDAMYEWLENVKKPTITSQSYNTIKKTIKYQIEKSEIAHLRYKSIRTMELQTFVNELNTVKKYSYSTIRKTYLALSAFYKYSSAVNKYENPMANVVMPSEKNVIKQSKEIQYLAETDIIKFVKTACEEYKSGQLVFKYGPVIAANIFLGLRISELLVLRWEDIDFENKVVCVSKTLIEEDNPDYDIDDLEKMKVKKISKKIYKVQNYTKNKKTRYVSMNQNAEDLLLFYFNKIGKAKADNLVISTYSGKTSDISGIGKTIKLIQKRAGITNMVSGTHSIRHTTATLYFSKGINIETICSILGNTREVAEKTYVHIIEENKKKAASMIELADCDI